MNRRPNILFLPRWYPHRYDPMPGLFIRQQAEALTGQCNVAVLYVHADGNAVNNYEIEVSEENGVHVVRVYYHQVTTRIPFLSEMLKVLRFFKAHSLGMRVLRSFKPDLLHVHVLTRGGIVAWWKRIRTGTPYVITEHWSRYLPASNSFHGYIRKAATREVVRSASAVVAVSETLKKAMQKYHLENSSFFVVHNPVDTRRFVIGEPRKNREKIRFIHISCFEDRSKNISGFLKAVGKIAGQRNDFEARLIGDGPEFNLWKNRAAEWGISADVVSFSGLKVGEELVNEIQSADFFVLSSNYETFGTVVIECLLCGIPVVATKVGVVSEVIREDNGIVIAPGSQEELETAISRMLDTCSGYDKQRIREKVVSEFSNESIAGELLNIYSHVIRN
jgi:L-malate glycosyltransferase